MPRLTLAIILSFALAALSQEPKVRVVPRTLSLPIPQMEKGIVEGNTYKNPSIGIEFSPPSELALGTPELKGSPGTVPLLVTVAAWSEQRWFSRRNGVIFSADALAYYPDGQRSTEAYMRKVIKANRNEGFEPVGQIFDAKLGEVRFFQTDFQKDPVYEAVFVKACKTQALVFIFASSSREAANKLIAGTTLKLDAARSGCDANADGAKR